MMAWMNEDALRKTIKTNNMYYYSRSRSKLWRKGETSGHFQKLHKLRLDCDGDTLLALIEQTGAACHTGAESCFFKNFDDGKNGK
jgi:phosphoribosyl-AMP cyclohydrolase